MDIKKALEKLQSIDAKDLKKINLSKLKEFDIERFKEELYTKPKILISSILIFSTIIFVFYCLASYRKLSTEIQKEITIMNKKNLRLSKTQQQQRLITKILLLSYR